MLQLLNNNIKNKSLLIQWVFLHTVLKQNSTGNRPSASDTISESRTTPSKMCMEPTELVCHQGSESVWTCDSHAK